MNGLVLCLVGLTLLVSGATAALPALWLTRAPAARPAPQGGAEAGTTLWLVRGGGRHWFVNGEPITAPALAQLLRSEGATADVRLLPSSALPIGEVSEALGWLRRQGAAAVVLELPEGR
ncbi:hypothetical protein NZK33_16095 [Cyanobium sp. FGCU-6]|jgi:hypothetical protein|nr:hypothetical protein [Cyanobium sp. FGCU6]